MSCKQIQDGVQPDRYFCSRIPAASMDENALDHHKNTYLTQTHLLLSAVIDSQLGTHQRHDGCNECVSRLTVYISPGFRENTWNHLCIRQHSHYHIESEILQVLSANISVDIIMRCMCVHKHFIRINTNVRCGSCKVTDGA